MIPPVSPVSPPPPQSDFQGKNFFTRKIFSLTPGGENFPPKIFCPEQLPRGELGQEELQGIADRERIKNRGTKIEKDGKEGDQTFLTRSVC